jgi:type III pantothenate kinase
MPLLQHFLTLDVGNTSVRIGIFSGDILTGVIALDPKHLSRSRLQSLLKTRTFSACIISSVTPVPAALLRLLRKHMKVLRLSSRLKLPLRNAYRTPSTLGNDRLACIAGAYRLFPRIPVLVIDAGTCIKYDIINAGTYYGGSITPGLRMRFAALHHYTHALPRLAPGNIHSSTGRDTVTSIRSGVQEGIRFEMEGFISMYRKQYPHLKIVVTGGDGSRLAKPLKSNIFAAPHLIHHGLYEILKNNLG